MSPMLDWMIRQSSQPDIPFVRRRPRSFALAACIGAALVAAACDDSFQPTQPTELAFSVFGYLDASADTQWIRVQPIRTLKVTSPDPLVASVTLEEVGTGRIIELRDSLFAFSSYSDPDLGSEGAYVHNFWTTEPIEPGATYRFVATREGKEPAEAVVAIPQDYGVEVEIGQSMPRPPDWPRRQPWPGAPSDMARISGVKHLAFLTTVTHYTDDCGSSIGRAEYTGASAEDTTHVISVRKPAVPPRDTSCHTAMIENRELRIVGSDAAWPISGYSQRALGEANWTSNVTNGVGFLAGILTKVVPYEDCTFESDGPTPDYCLLRYNAETTILTGTVTESGCGYGPIPSATVQLTEIGPDPARVRSVKGTQAGKFVIGMDPGISYALWVRAPDAVVDSTRIPFSEEWAPVFADVHTRHTDTLTVMPSQTVQYDIQLDRLLLCGQQVRYRWP